MTAATGTETDLVLPVLVLRIYVAGDAPNSLAALAALRGGLAQVTSQGEGARVELEIIDVLREPERGLRDGVLVTPLLVRSFPSPERRMLGNLSDHQRLMTVLTPARVHRGDPRG